MADDVANDTKNVFVNPWGRKYTLPTGGIREQYPSSLLDNLSIEQYQLFLDGKWPPQKDDKQPR